jgi:hypothetical protein
LVLRAINSAQSAFLACSLSEAFCDGNFALGRSECVQTAVLIKVKRTRGCCMQVATFSH